MPQIDIIVTGTKVCCRDSLRSIEGLAILELSPTLSLQTCKKLSVNAIQYVSVTNSLSVSVSSSLRNRLALPALLAFASLLAAFIVVRTPLSGQPMAQTLEWAQTGRISSTFLPVAYPLFSGIGYRTAGMHGIIAMQVILYLLIVLFSFMTLTSLRLPRAWAAIASLPIVMNPDLLLSIQKFWIYH